MTDLIVRRDSPLLMTLNSPLIGDEASCCSERKKWYMVFFLGYVCLLCIRIYRDEFCNFAVILTSEWILNAHATLGRITVHMIWDCGTCGLIISLHVPDVTKPKVIFQFVFFLFSLTYIKYISVICLTLQRIWMEPADTSVCQNFLIGHLGKKVSVFRGQVKNLEMHHTGT